MKFSIFIGMAGFFLCPLIKASSICHSEQFIGNISAAPATPEEVVLYKSYRAIANGVISLPYKCFTMEFSEWSGYRRAIAQQKWVEQVKAVGVTSRIKEQQKFQDASENKQGLVAQKQREVRSRIIVLKRRDRI